MNNRNFQYNEWAGPTTNGFDFLTANVALSGTVGDRYLMFGTIAAGINSGNIRASLVFNSGVYEYDHYIAVRDTLNDMYSCPMMFPRVLEGGETLELYIERDSGDVTARQAGVYAFRLLDNDVTSDNYFDDGGYTSSTTYATVNTATKTFTVPTAGDYLFLCTATVSKNETTAAFNTRFVVDSVAYGDATMRMKTADKFLPYAAMVKLTLSAGSHTMSVEQKVTSTGMAQCAYPSMVALCMADWPQIHSHSTASDTSTTTGAWVDVDAMDSNFRLAEKESLILSYGLFRRAVANIDVGVQTIHGSGPTTAQENRNEFIGLGIEAVHFSAARINPTAGDYTIKQQLYNYAAGISTIADCAIAVLQMADDSTVRIRGASILGATIL